MYSTYTTKYYTTATPAYIVVRLCIATVFAKLRSATLQLKCNGDISSHTSSYFS